MMELFDSIAGGVGRLAKGLGWSRIILIIALALAVGWGKRVDHLRAGWRTQTLTITAAIGEASGNPKLKPGKAAAAAQRLGIDLMQCRENNRTLEEGIGRQNRAVEAAKQTSDARVSRVQQRLTLADGERDEAVRRADRLLHGRTAPDGDVIAACAAADKLILETIR